MARAASCCSLPSRSAVPTATTRHSAPVAIHGTPAIATGPSTAAARWYRFASAPIPYPGATVCGNVSADASATYRGAAELAAGAD